ncbi:MAG: cation:proton antiporter [Aestuariibacter sp.]
MDFIWIFFAFACGFGCRLVSLPPLIGFLSAGFLLNAFGVEPDDSLQVLADLGITLMLFTVGLKLNIKELFKREVWAGTTLSMMVWIVLFTSFSMLYMTMGLSYFAFLDMKIAALLAFALSFSSTVCIVKMLEDGGEMKTRHGKVAIGILVMQDIFAVLFLVLATGKIPSIYALSLLALPIITPALSRLLNASGHGELLPLTGFFFAIGGYELFELVGVKGDLGALVFGILLSSHVKSTELAKSLLGFKDLFLIGFFLSIGFIALPNWEMLLMAGFICVLLPFKFLYFFWVFNRLKLKGRTSFLSGLTLSNYSEFGLIVVALAVSNQWIDPDWLVILAISVSISFVLSSVGYRYAHKVYTSYKDKINFLERPERLPEDFYEQPENATVLVVGMGRVGKGSYQALHNVLRGQVWGVDADSERVAEVQEEGWQVICADAEDIDFWETIALDKIRLILLALPSTDDASNICQQLESAGFNGKIAAIARFEDDRQTLLATGVHHVFNFYTEAGQGFADESLCLMDESELSPAPVNTSA